MRSSEGRLLGHHGHEPMLTLTVSRHNGELPEQPLAAQFDETGGTIGRAETNRLVLVDAERTVSRVHAQIVMRDGRYGLIDRGSNPALVNGRALEPGEEVPLGDGDEVQIGGYQLRAQIDARAVESTAAPTVSNDPFADIFRAPHTQDTAFDNLLGPLTEPDSPRTPADTLPADFDLGFNDPAQHRTIDELYGLGPGSDTEAPDSATRLGAFDEPLSAPNTAQDADPFASLTGESHAQAPRAPYADHSSELHSALPMQRARPEPAERVEPESTDDAALRRAFLEGLGVDVGNFTLTPARMRLIGGLLRESTQGTLDLLAARAATKREMRADATLIVAEENNPLKFSPNVDTALAHLLRPPARGFMPAETALADAFDDLRAHQVGFVAGMRAALDGVFERFEPARIETRLTQHSLLDTLLPQLNRRARCWDLFTELYGQLASEAEDDFHTLFGRAFVAAYEAQIDRLKRRA